MTQSPFRPAPAPGLVFLLWVAGLAAAAQFAKMAVPFPEVAALHPEAAGRMGWVLSVIGGVGALLGIVCGDLVGRIGARRVLLGGLVLGGAVSLAQAAGMGFALLLASRVVEGVSHLAIVVAAPALMVRAAGPRHEAAAMALWSTFFGVAFAAVAWAGLPLVAARGPQALFLVHGAALLALALALGGSRGLRRIDDPVPRRAGGPSFAGAHRRAYRSAFVAAPGIGWLFYATTYVALLAVLPETLPGGMRAALTGALPLLGIVASLTLGPLALRRMGGAATAAAGFALALAASCLLPLGVSPVLAAALLFAAFGLVQAGSFAAVPELNAAEEDRALAYGVMAQTGNAGNLIGTPLLLTVLGAGGAEGVFAAVGLLYALALGAQVVLHRRRRAARDRGGGDSSPHGGPRVS